MSYKANDLTFGGNNSAYASPYNDMSKKYLPSTQRDLFRWCQYYLDNSPIIQQAIRRMSSYPITKLIPLLEDEAKQDKAEDVLKVLKVRDVCQNIAMQYFAFGNAFATIVSPYQRYYECQECKTKFTYKEAEQARIKFKEKGQLFRMKRKGRKQDMAIAKCPRCKVQNAHISCIDKPVKNLDETRIVLLHPLNLRIEKNQVSGKCEYRFVMPASMRKKILAGDCFLIETSPKIFVEAAIYNKDIVLNEESIYHFCRINADSMTGWGHPLIQGVLRELFHSQVIKKAAEALAIQHINPLMIVYPRDSGQSNIYQHLDMSNWSKNMEGQLRQWRKDPNHIPLMPVPTGVDYIGGQHRSLDPTAALSHMNEEIAMGMGVPKEFLIGGTTFSSSSIALRMLENDFINLRNMLLEFINGFLLPSAVKVCDTPSFEVKFTNLRTADDVQQKDLMLRLMQMGKMSSETVLDELGFDSAKEADRIYEEMKKAMDKQQKMNSEELGQPMLYNVEVPTDGSMDLSMTTTEDMVGFIGNMMQQSPPDAQQFYSQMMQQQAPNIYAAVNKHMGKSSPSQQANNIPDQKPSSGPNSQV